MNLIIMLFELIALAITVISLFYNFKYAKIKLEEDMDIEDIEKEYATLSKLTAISIVLFILIISVESIMSRILNVDFMAFYILSAPVYVITFYISLFFNIKKLIALKDISLNTKMNV